MQINQDISNPLDFIPYIDHYICKNQTKVRISFLFFVFFCFSLQAQSDDVFQLHASRNDVTHITVPPSMFGMLSKLKLSTNDPETEALMKMVQSLTLFRVMTTRNTSIAKDMQSWVNQEIQQTSLMSLLNVKKEGVRVQFAAVFSTRQDQVKRLVMWVQGLEQYVEKNPDIQLDSPADLDYILLEIKGDLPLDQISALTQIVNIPGGNYLEALNN